MTDLPARQNTSYVEPDPALQAQHAQFALVFRSEASFVWRSLRRLGVPAADLEDICNEVFLTFYRRQADYDPARPLRPWLFGIAYRTAARYRELARHRREVSSDTLEARDERPGPDEQLAAFESRWLFAQALAGLELDRRAVFIMHDIEGCGMAEIAASLEIPLNTGYSRLRLAREQLKGALQQLRRRPGDL